MGESGKGQFRLAGQGKSKELLPGVTMQEMVHGEKTLMAGFNLRQGARIPLHHHPHEQTGYLVRGSIRLTVAGEARDLREGDSWCIAGEVEHQVEVLADAVVIEVFAPLRREYLL